MSTDSVTGGLRLGFDDGRRSEAVRALTRGNRDVFHILMRLVLAICVVLFPLLAALAYPLLAFPFCLILCLSLASFAGREAPAIILFAMLFQNLFVSLLSTLIEDPANFNLFRGLVFFDTVVVWLVFAAYFLQARAEFPPEVRRFMWLGFAALALVGVYAALGFVSAGNGAVIYTRNITTPILVFQISLVAASRGRLNISGFLLTLLVFVFILGYVELLDRALWLKISNSMGYWQLNYVNTGRQEIWENELKNTGQVYVDIYDYFRVTLLNSTYFTGIQIYRAHGPNMHAISYGYVLAFSCLFFFANRWRLVALSAVPLLVFASAKGAMLETLFVMFGWFVTKMLGPRIGLVLFAVLAGAYIVVGVTTGLNQGDYHVIGLMGGINGFMANPIGHGVGVGGNLTGGVDVEQWQAAQHLGAFDGAVESAVGVLLYQMGVAAFAVLGYYALIILAAWRIYARTGVLQHGLATWGCFAILVNGVFQEEALFSPLAMGMMLCFTGIVIGSAARNAVAPPP